MKLPRFLQSRKKWRKHQIHNLIGSIGAALGIFVFLAYIPQISGYVCGLETSVGRALVPDIFDVDHEWPTYESLTAE